MARRHHGCLLICEILRRYLGRYLNEMRVYWNSESFRMPCSMLFSGMIVMGPAEAVLMHDDAVRHGLLRVGFRSSLPFARASKFQPPRNRPPPAPSVHPHIITTIIMASSQPPLVDYSDSDDSDCGPPPSKLQKKSAAAPKPADSSSLPPLPSRFHDLYAVPPRIGQDDSPALHGGRKRSIPHVQGNWPTHIFVECMYHQHPRGRDNGPARSRW